MKSFKKLFNNINLTRFLSFIFFVLIIVLLYLLYNHKIIEGASYLHKTRDIVRYRRTNNPRSFWETPRGQQVARAQNEGVNKLRLRELQRAKQPNIINPQGQHMYDAYMKYIANRGKVNKLGVKGTRQMNNPNQQLISNVNKLGVKGTRQMNNPNQQLISNTNIYSFNPTLEEINAARKLVNSRNARRLNRGNNLTPEQAVRQQNFENVKRQLLSGIRDLRVVKPTSRGDITQSRYFVPTGGVNPVGGPGNTRFIL